MRVLLTGGSGLVGREIIWNLCHRGDTAVVLTRDPVRAANRFRHFPDHDLIEFVAGNPIHGGRWQGALEECDAVINLAGEPVFGKRWSETQRKRLRDSRVNTTKNVVEAIAQAEDKPLVLVSASAIGYYGDTGEEEINEDSPPGKDFLSGVCTAWENAALAATELDVRVAVMRIGVVLDEFDGALATMKTPFKLFVGGPIGRGQMWMSWIHVADVAGAFLKAVDDANVSGIMNVVSPNPVRNKEFSKALGKALRRPSFFPVPPFMLKLLYGESADIILASQHVSPKRLLEFGYQFQHPECCATLASIFGPESDVTGKKKSENKESEEKKSPKAANAT